MLIRQIAFMSDSIAARSKKKERRRAATLDGFGDIPRRNETALMQVRESDQFICMGYSRVAMAGSPCAGIILICGIMS